MPELPAAHQVALGFLGQHRGNTQAAYRTDLACWLQWCADRQLEPLAHVKRHHLQEFRLHLEGLGRAPATISRRLSAIAGYYAYAVVDGRLECSPVDHLRRPKVAQDSPTLGLDRGELDALLEVAAASSAGDEAVACLLALNGLRVSEVCGADVEDLGLERGHHTLAVTRKGGRRELAPMAERTARAVERHRGRRRCGPLVVVDGGSRLSRSAAYRRVRALAREAGVTKTISPHSLRHTFVTLSLDAGVALHIVQDAAGHADPRTTRRYDRARHRLDGHATYQLQAFLDGAR